MDSWGKVRLNDLTKGSNLTPQSIDSVDVPRSCQDAGVKKIQELYIMIDACSFASVLGDRHLHSHNASQNVPTLQT